MPVPVIPIRRETLQAENADHKFCAITKPLAQAH